MSRRFASAKRALAECDICGFRFYLRELRNLDLDDDDSLSSLLIDEEYYIDKNGRRRKRKKGG